MGSITTVDTAFIVIAIVIFVGAALLMTRMTRARGKRAAAGNADQSPLESQIDALHQERFDLQQTLKSEREAGERRANELDKALIRVKELENRIALGDPTSERLREENKSLGQRVVALAAFARDNSAARQGSANDKQADPLANDLDRALEALAAAEADLVNARERNAELERAKNELEIEAAQLRGAAESGASAPALPKEQEREPSTDQRIGKFAEVSSRMKAFESRLASAESRALKLDAENRGLLETLAQTREALFAATLSRSQAIADGRLRHEQREALWHDEKLRAQAIEARLAAARVLGNELSEKALALESRLTATRVQLAELNDARAKETADLQQRLDEKSRDLAGTTGRILGLETSLTDMRHVTSDLERDSRELTEERDRLREETQALERSAGEQRAEHERSAAQTAQEAAQAKARIRELEDDVAQLESGRAQLISRRDELEKIAEELKARAQSQAGDLARNQDQLQKLRGDIGQLESQRAALATRHEALEKLSEDLAARGESQADEIAQGKKQIEALRAEVAQLESERAELSARRAQLEQSVTELNSREQSQAAQILQLGEDIDRGLATAARLQSEGDELRRRVAELTTSESALTERNESLARDLRGTKEELTQTRGELRKLTQAHEALEARYDEIEASHRALTEEFAELNQALASQAESGAEKIDDSRRFAAERERELAETRGRLEALTSAIAEHEARDAKLTKDKLALQQDLQQARESLGEAQAPTQELSQLKAALDQARSEIEALKARVQSQEATHRELTAERLRLRDELIEAGRTSANKLAQYREWLEARNAEFMAARVRERELEAELSKQRTLAEQPSSAAQSDDNAGLAKLLEERKSEHDQAVARIGELEANNRVLENRNESLRKELARAQEAASARPARAPEEAAGEGPREDSGARVTALQNELARAQQRNAALHQENRQLSDLLRAFEQELSRLTAMPSTDWDQSGR
jgi:golgin subfamily B member 1